MFFLLANHRTVTPEIMDRPDVDPADHLDALEALRRINNASNAADSIFRPIEAMARRENLKNLSILDIACGGGDVPIAVATQLKSAGIDVDLTLLDRSPTALHGAADAAHRAQIPCHTIQADISQPWPDITADVVTCSLFLHHLLEPAHVVDFLSKARAIAKKQIVISDLRRSRLGYLIAFFGGRILSRSKIVHHDGPVSVRAAWTINEMTTFARNAKLTNAKIQPSFPWRMLLTWEIPQTLNSAPSPGTPGEGRGGGGMTNDARKGYQA
jgi:2-polyprenyl-3-methyl-5-hydroxy-6-metoxy-1,4-benzoquinol methylase